MTDISDSDARDLGYQSRVDHPYWLGMLEQHVALHGEHSQNQARIRLALAQVREGIEMLGALGHHFHLAEGPAPTQSGGRFPRLVYFVSGIVREVLCQADLTELGPGWYNSLEEARYRAGIEAQFAGRGGIRVARLPTVVSVPDDGVDVFEHETGRYVRRPDVQARIEEFTANHDAGDPDDGDDTKSG